MPGQTDLNCALKALVMTPENDEWILQTMKNLTPRYTDPITGSVFIQALINGNFQVNQQALSQYTSSTVPANNDDTYIHDMWNLLSDGNNIVEIDHDTIDHPLGGTCSCKFIVVTPNKKFGYVQFIEKKDAMKFANEAVSLQFKACTSAGHVINNVRAAILSWVGTTDILTSDVVSAWNEQGTNPSWATNWIAENTAANLALVNDVWTTYSIENIVINTSGMKNLAVVIWVDDTDSAAGDSLSLADVQLNVGATSLPYQPISFESDLRKCMRFWEKSYNYDTPIQTDTYNNAVQLPSFAYSESTSFVNPAVEFRVPKRVAPIFTTYRKDGGKVNPNYWLIGSGYHAYTPWNINERGVIGYFNGNLSGQTPGHGIQISGHWVADSRLWHGARICYYDGRNPSKYQIGLVTGDAIGLNCVKFAGNPILTEGSIGAWDDAFVSEPCVVHWHGKYYMFYGGGKADHINKVGLAISDDGVTFTKYGTTPVLDVGGVGAWDHYSARFPMVFWDSGTNKWWMIYMGYNGTNLQGGLAYSTDLISWTKSSHNPILTVVPGTWESLHTASVSNPVKVDGTYYLLYGAYGVTWQTGLVTFATPEGTWTKSPNNPVIKRRPNAHALLTQTLLAGTKVVHVANTTAFMVREPVFLESTTGSEINRIASIDSGTQLTLSSNVANTWSKNNYILSCMSGSNSPRGLFLDGAIWRAFFTPFGFSLVVSKELSFYATGADLTSLTIQYASCPTISLSDNPADWDGLSAENQAFIQEGP
jgi:hypothetical protein